VGLVGPVAGARPYIERGIVDGPHIDVIDCGGFTATLVRTFTGTNYYFVDSQGNLLRAVTNAEMVGSLTSSTGTSIGLRGHIHFVFDSIKGTFAFDGQVFMATRPTFGVVLQDTGKYLTDLSDNVLLDAGPHDVTDLADPFCPVLA
jgi:hypothetical protein